MMFKKLFKAALVIGLSVFWICAAEAQTASNGKGSTTHSAVNTAYNTGNQLFANNTSGNAVATPITINAVPPGQALTIRALIYSTGTNKPGTSTLWLYSQAPTTTGLADYSAYIGPYLSDLQANIYIGYLSCSAWQATNDSTAKYFSECSGSSQMLSTALGQFTSGSSVTIYALEEIGAYTPIASEIHTYLLSTLHEN